MATRGSAASFSAIRPDHLHTEGRTWPPKSQQQVLQQRDHITYFLRAGDAHQRINRFWGKEARLLTLWAADGHQGVSSRSCRKETTYFLRAGDGHQKVSRAFVMNKWSECNMHTINSYLQTTMMDSTICLYINV